METLLPIIALIFGLGLPRSFTLLYLISAISLWRASRSHIEWKNPLTCWSVVNLTLFGLCYSIIMIWHGTWIPIKSHTAEIIAITCAPSLALITGWNYGNHNTRDSSKLIIAYIIGGLAYALISIVISHDKIINLAETFNHVLRVPWGPNKYESIRAVEQRSFMALCLAPCIFLPSSRHANNIAYSSFISILSLLGLYVSYVTSTRIGIASLYLSLIPLIWYFKNQIVRIGVMILTIFTPIMLVSFNKLCDERVFLVHEFIMHMPYSIMGGRNIRFEFDNCLPSGHSYFGNYDGITTFTPHNVVLDVYNDTGIIPFIFLLGAVLPLAVSIICRLIEYLNWYGPNNYILIRWAVFSVISVQWFAQPFLYTDQLMFSLAFICIGIFLKETEKINTSSLK